jgi:hypothetical protein
VISQRSARCETLQRQEPSARHSPIHQQKSERAAAATKPAAMDIEERIPMKTIAFVALAILGLVVGTANLASPAHAATYYFAMSRSNDGNNGGGSN